MLLLWGDAAAARQDGNEVTLSVKPLRMQVRPGDQIPIAVVFAFEPGWHIYLNHPGKTPGMVKGNFDPTPTTLDAKPSDGITVWPVQWPKPTPVKVKISAEFGLEPYEALAGRAVAFVPIQISPDAKPGTRVSVELAIFYQACDEVNCLLPQDVTETVSLTVIAPGSAPTANGAPDKDFATFDPAVFGTDPKGAFQAGASAAKPVKFSAFGLTFSVNAAGIGFLVLLLVAALGGLLLNFTPCVLPVVPLKIMGLSSAAGNPARCFFLGAAMSLGTVAFWIGIGAAIAFISGFTAINSLFQTAWFALAVGAFILVMAVGMLGAFAIRLPQFVYMVNTSHESAGGYFLFGIMTAVLATPCTAPFMGSAAAWATTQPSYISLTTFGAIGVGMALPYLVLSAFPSLLNRMPRVGPASELIKQVMGLLLVAVAVFFLGTGLDPLLRLPVDPPIRFFWWIIALFGVGAMVWLVVRTFQITHRPLPRVVWTAFAGVFSVATVLIVAAVTDRGPIPWVGYTPERLAEQLRLKKVVVLDFTAEWCINCKALEGAVLHRAEIVRLLTSPGVVPMRVDLTGNNIPGKAKLKEVGWVGIPLLVVYGPGLQEPFMSDAYTTDMVKDAIAKAAGAPGLNSAPVILPTASPDKSLSGAAGGVP